MAETLVRYRQRIGTAAAWTTADPVLADGELGFESDTRLFKVGDGVTAWTALAYPPSGGGGGVTDHGALTGLTDDDHAIYALADGTRGSFATTAQGALADSATQPADLASYQVLSAKGLANGYASLDGSAQIPAAQIPSIAITEYLGDVADEAAMLALTGEKGDWCTRQDDGAVWIITGADPSVIGGWTSATYPASPVVSVAGKVGVVTLVAADISDLGNAAGDDYGSGSGTVCEGDDSRLSDARTPTAHDQASDTITTTVKTVSTTTYTFLADDDGKYIIFDNVAGCTATAPDTLAAGWSVGCEQDGAAQLEVAVSGSMTLRNRQGHTKTAGLGAIVHLVVRGANKLSFAGDTGT